MLQPLSRVVFYKTFPSYSLLFAVVQNLSNPSILQQLGASAWTGRVLFPNFSFPYRKSNKWSEAAQQPQEDTLHWGWENAGFPHTVRVGLVLKLEICILDSYIRIAEKQVTIRRIKGDSDRASGKIRQRNYPLRISQYLPNVVDSALVAELNNFQWDHLLSANNISSSELCALHLLSHLSEES